MRREHERRRQHERRCQQQRRRQQQRHNCSAAKPLFPRVSTTPGVPCQLAGNTLYEYYKAVQNGKDTTALMVWSPAVTQYRTANCSKGADVVTCQISGTNVPNAQV